MIHITTGAEATGGMVFGLSDELPVLQNLMCNGSEYSLSYCPGYDLNNVTGEHCLSGDYQAGVRCIEGKNMTLILIKEIIRFLLYTVCNDEDFRLGNERYGSTSDGYSFYGGRVEVCQDGVYGAICDIGWNREAAQAVCDYLGYSYRGIFKNVNSHTISTPLY